MQKLKIKIIHCLCLLLWTAYHVPTGVPLARYAPACANSNRAPQRKHVGPLRRVAYLVIKAIRTTDSSASCVFVLLLLQLVGLLLCQLLVYADDVNPLRDNKRYHKEKHKQTKTNSVALVRKQTIPTERPPLVGEVSANFSG
jgi:hypothetical protein